MQRLNYKGGMQMDSKGQAKLYYLYMMSDGVVSENEMKLFNKICEELYLSEDEKKNVIKECKKIRDYEDMTCIDVLEKNVEEAYIYGTLSIDLGSYIRDEDKAKVLWNLVNLGYADSYYTVDEREVVDFLKEYWEISDDLYQEMIDVAETCLALEKHKKWIESLPDSDYKLKKIKQAKKDIKFAQYTIVATISEIRF